MICPICRKEVPQLELLTDGSLSQLACPHCRRRMSDASYGQSDYDQTLRGLCNVLLDIVDVSAAVSPTLGSLKAHIVVSHALRALPPVRICDELQNVFPFVKQEERRCA